MYIHKKRYYQSGNNFTQIEIKQRTRKAKVYKNFDCKFYHRGFYILGMGWDVVLKVTLWPSQICRKLPFYAVTAVILFFVFFSAREIFANRFGLNLLVLLSYFSEEILFRTISVHGINGQDLLRPASHYPVWMLCTGLPNSWILNASFMPVIGLARVTPPFLFQSNSSSKY